MRRLTLAMLVAVPALALGQEAEKPAAEAAPGAEAANEGGAQVADAKLGTGVQDREPQGVATSFKPDVGKVYCWTKVTGAEGGEITHVWYKGDEKMTEVKLPIKYASTRTWSAKTIPADGKGDWKVEVLGPDGTVLQTLTFTIAE